MKLYHTEGRARGRLDRLEHMIRRVIIIFVLLVLIFLFVLEVSIPDIVL